MKRRVGSTDLSRLDGTVLPPPRAMLLTRQGISLEPFLSEINHLGEQRVPFTLFLHVAMQMGLYLHRGESRCLASSL